MASECGCVIEQEMRRDKFIETFRPCHRHSEVYVSQLEAQIRTLTAENERLRMAAIRIEEAVALLSFDCKTGALIQAVAALQAAKEQWWQS